MEINVNDGTETTKHMYILVRDLADVYTADEVSITLSNNNVFSIKDLGVSTSKLADNSVTTAKIKNGNVTNDKLATAVQNTISEKATISYVDQQIANIEGDIEIDLDSKADVNHTHFLDDINITQALGANSDLNDYTSVGIYTCSKSNSATLANKPYSGDFACIIENKKYSSGYVIQFVYKITTNPTTFYDAYFRCYNGTNGWTADWVRIFTDHDMAKVNASNLKLNSSSNVSIEDAIAGKVDSTDSRLSDARTPKSHTHGNLSNDGKVGTTANKPLITGANGIVSAGSFGTGANTFCQGNDSRLSDYRIPKTTEITGTVDEPFDLDSLVETGLYYGNRANVLRTTNTPDDTYASRYVVFVEGFEQTSNYMKQTFTFFNNGKTYVRNKKGSSWTSWVELTSTVDSQLSSTSTNPLQNKAINTALSGKAPNNHASSATTYGAANASNYGHAMASSTTPKANGTAAVGSETSKFARGDHIHPLPSATSSTLSFLNPQAMSGTVRYVENNGWATIYYENVQCTSTQTGYTEFVQLPKACASNGAIYAFQDLTHPPGIAFRVEGNYLKGRCFDTSARMYGHITYPIVV